MNIRTITNQITQFLDEKVQAVRFLPATIVLCIARQRPGLSAYNTTAKIIENNRKIGIETGPNADGSTNVINQYTYSLVKNIYDALENDSVVTAAIPMQSLLIQVTGGNAGGPVTCIGTNITDTNSHGITQ